MAARHAFRATLLFAALVAGVPPVAAGDALRTVAILPLHNLSDESFPRPEIETVLTRALERQGLQVLPADDLDELLRRHRVRWTGGVSRKVAEAFAAETEVDALVVTSIDAYDDSDPPRFSLTCRLVSVGDLPRILWMDAAHLAGHESPGAFNLGRVHDPLRLVEQAVERVTDSLGLHLSGQPVPRPPWKSRDRFAPKTQFGSMEAIRSRLLRIAVVPLLDASDHGHAGEIVMLQLVRQLVAPGVLDLVEPGVVRQALLQVRIIQRDGLSLAQADALRALLDVDVVVTGRVSEYRNGLSELGTPAVEFSLRVLDTATRQVVWSSFSHNRGNDRLYFFETGRVHTAQALAFEMTRAAVKAMTRWTAKDVGQLR